MKTTTRHRVFIIFAVEDKRQRDFLAAQARNDRSPFQFIDMSVKRPWDDKWKTRCRRKIKGCDGVIALISKHTAKAEGAKWEIACAIEEDIPIVGMYAYSDDRSDAPRELRGTRVMTWTWDNISAFLRKLEGSGQRRSGQASTATHGSGEQGEFGTVLLIGGAIVTGVIILLLGKRR